MRCFNPRARTGRDTASLPGSVLSIQFQPTRPYGARLPMAQPTTDQHAAFQPTRPYGARLLAKINGGMSQGVSTHAPVRGATRVSGVVPRPTEVSTHAPVRGATQQGNSSDGSAEMFQPTRPYGARQISCMCSKVSYECFNPRARTGRDHLSLTTLYARGVSTHAPVRGATVDASPQQGNENVSTHAPVRGATKRQCARAAVWPRFNPRARTGRDYRHGASPTLTAQVSTHAPVRGATGRHGPYLRGL